MKKIILSLTLLLIPAFVYAEEVDLAPNAKAAIIVEASTGTILYQKNIHEKLPPASMTKMMGMLLVVESVEKGQINWDDIVIVSENASSMGGSQILLETGEKMTVDDLFKGVAVASGNDAIVALGEKIAGTEEMFVKMMNDRAKELGLKNTNFKNPHGLEEANHYTSAYDISKIALELVKHPKVLEYTGIYEDYLRKGTNREFWLVNTNKLVRFNQNVDGLKTGYTKEAGYCLTATASKDGMRLITVVFGEPESSTRNKETTGMLDYGFSMYSVEKLLSKDLKVGTIKIYASDKETYEIVPMKDVNILNNKTQEKRNVTYEINTKTLSAPIKKGEVVGKLKIIENNKTIDEIDITVKNDVKKANIFKLYLRNIKNIITGNTL
ncbi:MAG: D-alanyl-D-alanine carboxypeptidase family protein [Bacilli bacterium]